MRILRITQNQASLNRTCVRKKGKLAFLEFKILTIDGNADHSAPGAARSSHISPRVYLRRGHIRRLKTKNVWVNSCVVGDKSKGIVQKDYLCFRKCNF